MASLQPVGSRGGGPGALEAAPAHGIVATRMIATGSPKGRHSLCGRRCTQGRRSARDRRGSRPPQLMRSLRFAMDLGSVSCGLIAFKQARSEHQSPGSPGPSIFDALAELAPWLARMAGTRMCGSLRKLARNRMLPNRCHMCVRMWAKFGPVGTARRDGVDYGALERPRPQTLSVVEFPPPPPPQIDKPRTCRAWGQDGSLGFLHVSPNSSGRGGSAPIDPT